MSDAHALLDAAWTTGDTTALLVLADFLDERAEHDTAELIRLTVAEGRTARHDRTRDQRLRQLRDGLRSRVRQSTWPDLAVQGGYVDAGFSRRPDAGRPDREHILVRLDHRTLHRLRVELDREDVVARTRGGHELLRCRLSPNLLDRTRQRGDLYAGGFLAHYFFPFPADWRADPAAAAAEQRRRFEAALSPAAIAIPDLPDELVPFVSWMLAEHLADRPRRVRGGEPVPGAHLFVFRDGGWHHAASLSLRDAGRASDLLRKRIRWMRGPGVLAGLLLRVADNGRITARKLAWIGRDGADAETANLVGAAATLPAAAFRRVAGEFELDEVAFVLDTPEKLRGLFGPTA